MLNYYKAWYLCIKMWIYIILFLTYMYVQLNNVKYKMGKH